MLGPPPFHALNPDDAERIRDFADRCGRVARTARLAAPWNPGAEGTLLKLAVRCDAAADTATDLADFADREAA